MKEILDIIIPVYGKNPKDTFENMQLLSEMKVPGVSFYVVYKNGNELNYDRLLDLNSDNFSIKKVDSSFFRTKKVLEGIRMGKSEYVVTLDSHHSISKDNLLKSINKIVDLKYDLIFMQPTEFNVDNGKSKKRKIKSLTAGRYIVKRELISSIYDEIDFDVVFHDDWTVGLFAMSTKKDIKTTWLKESFYIKKHGQSLSNTFGNRNADNIKRMLNDGGTILNYFINRVKDKEVDELNKEFMNQLYDLFKGMMRRFTWLNDKSLAKVKSQEKKVWFEELFKNDLNTNARFIFEVKNKIINRLYIEDYLAIRKKDLNLILENSDIKEVKND